MGIYVFALIDQAPARRAGRGFTSPVSLIHTDAGFAAVERRADVPPMEFGVLRAHERVVARLSELVPAVLPVRFGTLLSQDDLREALAERGEELREAFDLVRDRVQFTWRRSGPQARLRRAKPPMVPASSGAEYLRRAARAAAPAPPVALRIPQRLRPLSVGERFAPATALVPDALYHLVSRESIARYEAAAARLLTPDRDLVLSGPFPPYAFAPELL